jgi:hypothetical protein
LSPLKALAKIAIAAAIPTPIARATFHNTNGYFFQKKKIRLQDHPLFDLPCEEMFFKNFLKRSHRCWLWRLPWLWGQVVAVAMAIVAITFNNGDPNYVYPSCKVNI